MLKAEVFLYMLNQPLKPMLLQPMTPNHIKADWKASIKWDGFRIIIHYDQGKVQAFTRHGTDVTDRFPELQQIKLHAKTAIIDGECIAFDMTQANHPPKIWWDDAMTRFHTKKAASVKAISKTLKAHFPVWDVVFLNGQSVMEKTFEERRELLQTLLPPSEVISVTPLYDDGQLLFSNVKEQGLEGIVQYNTSSPYYLNSRPKDVITKIKVYQLATCQVSSIKKSTFGWGLQIDGKYVGTLEFPPHRDIIFNIRAEAGKWIKKETEDWIYLEPVISCKVRFQCFTKDGKLRSPVIQEIV